MPEHPTPPTESPSPPVATPPTQETSPDLLDGYKNPIQREQDIIDRIFNMWRDPLSAMCKKEGLAMVGLTIVVNEKLSATMNRIPHHGDPILDESAKVMGAMLGAIAHGEAHRKLVVMQIGLMEQSRTPQKDRNTLSNG